MPSPRRRPPAEDDATTRERILDTALVAFSELGFDGASTRHIATAAGVNQGLIPYYFGTKEALWHEAVDRAFEQLGAAMQGVGDAAGGDRKALEGLIRRFIRFVSAHPEFVRLMEEEGKRDGPRMRWLVKHHVRPLYEAMLALFEAAKVGSRLPASVDPAHLHYLFVGASTIFFHQAPEAKLLSGLDPTDPAVADAHADALIALFLGPEPSPGPDRK